jgi:hypothetical protein
MELDGYIIVFLSNDSYRSKWIESEIDYAFEITKSFDRIILAELAEGLLERIYFIAPEILKTAHVIRLYQKRKYVTRHKEMMFQDRT